MNIDARLNLRPPHCGQPGTSSSSWSATANPQPSHLNEPAPANVPAVKASIFPPPEVVTILTSTRPKFNERYANCAFLRPIWVVFGPCPWGTGGKTVTPAKPGGHATRGR